MIQKKGRLTRTDVAREAGVSETTVSYALSEGKFASEISVETRRRVKAAARRLGYTPSTIGTALKRGYSDTIVLLIHNLDMPAWHARTMVAISRIAADKGLSVNTHFVDNDEAAVSFIGSLPSRSPYGLLLESPPSSGLADLRAEGLPVVSLMPGEPEGIVSVTADREQGFRLLAEHLIGLGHRRIAIIADRLSETPSTKFKLAGYRTALETAGIDFDEGLVEDARGVGFGQGYEVFEKLTRRRPDATALLCIDDRSAIGVLAAAHDSGVRVPEDFSVTGWGNDPEGEYLRPSLTTLAAPSLEMAEDAVNLIVRMRENPGFVPHSVYAPMELIARQSTGPPPSRVARASGPKV